MIVKKFTNESAKRLQIVFKKEKLTKEEIVFLCKMIPTGSELNLMYSSICQDIFEIVKRDMFTPHFGCPRSGWRIIESKELKIHLNGLKSVQIARSREREGYLHLKYQYKQLGKLIKLADKVYSSLVIEDKEKEKLAFEILDNSKSKLLACKELLKFYGVK